MIPKLYTFNLVLSTNLFLTLDIGLMALLTTA